MLENEDNRKVVLWSYLLLFVGLCLMFLGKLRSYDLWWHLRAGRYIVEKGTVPYFDIFSYTAPGRAWIYHSWIGGVILSVIYEWGGLKALVLLRAVAIAGSLTMAVRVARRRGVSFGLAALLAVVCAYQLQPLSLMRPYLFSFLLFIIFYSLLQDSFQSGWTDQQRETSGGSRFTYLWGEGGHLLILPGLMLLWVNVHAGFVAGLLLAGCFVPGEAIRVMIGRDAERSVWRQLFIERAGNRFRSYVLIVVLCLVATIVTPYGAGVLTYPIRLLWEVDMVAEIDEWQPLALSAQFAPVWFMFAVVIFVVVRTGSRMIKTGRLWNMGQLAVDFAILGGFGVLSLGAARHIGWFCLVATPILGSHLGLSAALHNRSTQRSLSYTAFVLMMCILVIQLQRSKVSAGAIDEAKLPGKAVEYLEGRDIPGPMYNVYEWGGYLIWQRWPEQKVFIDGRCLVYGDEIIEQTVDVARGRDGWQGVLERYDIRSVLLRYPKYDVEHFFKGDQWRCVYWDETALIAVRKDFAGQMRQFEIANPVVWDDRLTAGNAEKALEEIDLVLDRDPENWRAWLFRGRILEKMYKGDEADKTHLREAKTAADRARALGGRTRELRELRNRLGGTGSYSE